MVVTFVLWVIASVVAIAAYKLGEVGWRVGRRRWADYQEARTRERRNEIRRVVHEELQIQESLKESEARRRETETVLESTNKWISALEEFDKNR